MYTYIVYTCMYGFAPLCGCLFIMTLVYVHPLHMTTCLCWHTQCRYTLEELYCPITCVCACVRCIVGAVLCCLSHVLLCTVALHLQLSPSPTLLLNSPSLPHYLPPSFQSPLPLAVRTKQKKVIQYLLKADANLLMCDCDGNAPRDTLPAVAGVKGAWACCSDKALWRLVAFQISI